MDGARPPAVLSRYSIEGTGPPLPGLQGRGDSHQRAGVLALRPSAGRPEGYPDVEPAAISRLTMSAGASWPC